MKPRITRRYSVRNFSSPLALRFGERNALVVTSSTTGKVRQGQVPASPEGKANVMDFEAMGFSKADLPLSVHVVNY